MGKAVVKHPGMTNAEFEVLGNYMRDIADMMGLRDWLFNLMHGVTEDGDALAEIHVTYGRRHADIRVCRDFRDIRPERQRATMCHELVHCHFEMSAAAVRDLRNCLGEQVWNSWHETYKMMLEHGVDAIAEAWAVKLPMIDWPKPPATKRAPRHYKVAPKGKKA